MRIIDTQHTFFSPLEAYKAGTPVRFETEIHPKHALNDLFIVSAVCSSYRPQQDKYRGKICVTNLRTGELAYLDKDRRCICVHASVHRGDDKPC